MSDEFLVLMQTSFACCLVIAGTSGCPCACAAGLHQLYQNSSPRVPLNMDNGLLARLTQLLLHCSRLTSRDNAEALTRGSSKHAGRLIDLAESLTTWLIPSGEELVLEIRKVRAH